MKAFVGLLVALLGLGAMEAVRAGDYLRSFLQVCAAALVLAIALDLPARVPWGRTLAWTLFSVLALALGTGFVEMALHLS